jgi:hypothetical protein
MPTDQNKYKHIRQNAFHFMPKIPFIKMKPGANVIILFCP